MKEPLNVIFILYTLLVRVNIFCRKNSLANQLWIYLVLQHVKTNSRIWILLTTEDVSNVLLELADVFRFAHWERVVVLRNLGFGRRERIHIHSNLIAWSLSNPPYVFITCVVLHLQKAEAKTTWEKKEKGSESADIHVGFTWEKKPNKDPLQEDYGDVNYTPQRISNNRFGALRACSVKAISFYENGIYCFLFGGLCM